MNFHINKISAVIFNRKSSKAYKENKLIPEEDLLSFFEAARWAPSSNNRQPWRYILFTEEHADAMEQMRSCLSTNNQRWARSAPVLILACTEIEDADGKPNRTALHDLGLANENLLIQIRSLGYHCRPMGGFSKEKTRTLFHIPDSFQPVLVIAAGFPGKTSQLPEDIQLEEQEPRTRNEIHQWVFQNQWNQKGFNNQ